MIISGYSERPSLLLAILIQVFMRFFWQITETQAQISNIILWNME